MYPSTFVSCHFVDAAKHLRLGTGPSRVGAGAPRRDAKDKVVLRPFDASLFDESLFDESDIITVSLSIVGTGTVSIQLSEITIPAPSAAGIRVAAWLRPAM